MQRPSTPDYYRDLGVEQTATLEEIQETFGFLEEKHRTDETQRPQRVQRGSAVPDSMSQARTAYEVLSQPSERAKYDGRYANVRASWFRYRKWTEWERGEEMAGAGGDSTPGNELTGYSRKLMDSIKERRARPSTVFVSGSPRSGGREEASDATEESEEDHSPQAWAAWPKTSRAAFAVVGSDDIQPESKSSDERARRPREGYADSHPQKHLCPMVGHHWHGWWPVMEVFVPPACLRCQLFASSFYCSACNTTVCLTCRLTQ